MPECNRVFFDGERFFCKNGSEHLDPFHVVYKAKKGQVSIVGLDGRQLSWFDVARVLSASWHDFWIMFAVYYDLRERGRILAHGPLPNSFTLYMGGKPKLNVFVAEETVSFPVKRLLDWMNASRKMGREPVLAIVDKHGDVSYYTLELFR